MTSQAFRAKSQWAAGVLLLAVLASEGGALDVQPPAREVGSGVTRALLIGVSRYRNLGAQQQLAGPPNDVALVESMLIAEPFSLPSTRITVLAELGTRRPGGTKPAGPPTRSNIERELRRLAEQSAPGDRAIIMFAGHGSQQPDAEAGGDEEDGLDEILLPSDVGRWDGTVGTVDRAITDDELGDWLTAIRNKGAFVWALIDACQSTSATRGSAEVARTVAPTALGVPAYLATRRRMRGWQDQAGVIGFDGGLGDIAALYAAQSMEPTPEKKLPEQSPQGRVHGLFTYTVVTTIQQAAGRLTYRDIAERVIQRYRALGRIAPTPGFEGGGLDRPVTGDAALSTRTMRLLLGPTTNGLTTLRAGAVHGLTKGAVLAVYPPDSSGSRDLRVGHVIVMDHPDATTAVVEPIAFAGMPVPTADLLVQNARCEVVLYDPGLSSLKLAFERMTGASPSLEQAVNAAARQLHVTTKGMATFVERNVDADWVIRVTGNAQVTLAPSSGWSVQRDAGGDGRATVALATNGSDVSSTLAAAVSAIARVSNLLKLAAPVPADGQAMVELEAYRYVGQPAEATSIVRGSGAVIRIGEVIAFRLRNTGTVPVDVHVLYVDANYGVSVVFPLPDQAATAALLPGAAVTTPRMKVTPPTGWEEVLVIATPRTALRQDLRMLEQPPLDQLSTRSLLTEDASRDLGSTSLGALVRAVSRHSERGQPVQGSRDYSVRMLTWRTEAPLDATDSSSPPP